MLLTPVLQLSRLTRNQTETLFHTYSQYASATKVPPKPTDEEERVEAQLNEILEKRSQVISQLGRILDADPGQSALKQNNLARHREILADHRRELQRLKTSLNDARNRANLLSNVRSDIDAYRSSNPGQQEADYMLDERRRIDESHAMADNVLSQAYAVNEGFNLQRETLTSINRRITGALSQVPGCVPLC